MDVICPNQNNLYFSNSYTEFHTGWWHSAGYVYWRSWRRRVWEEKWRRLEATSTTRSGNSSRFIAIEFLSHITNTRTRIRNVRTYIHIAVATTPAPGSEVLEKWFPLQGKRANSLIFCLFECMLIERKRRRGRMSNNYRAINFPRLYDSSQTTSPPPNTNFYHTQSILCQHSFYIHIYIHIYYELFYSQRLLLK